MKKKTVPDEEHTIQITETERFLFNLFKGIVIFGKMTCITKKTFFIVVISAITFPVAFTDRDAEMKILIPFSFLFGMEIASGYLSLA